MLDARSLHTQFHGKPFVLHETVNRSQVSNMAREGFKQVLKMHERVVLQVNQENASCWNYKKIPVKNIVQIQQEKTSDPLMGNAKMQMKQPAG